MNKLNIINVKEIENISYNLFFKDFYIKSINSWVFLNISKYFWDLLKLRYKIWFKTYY